MQVDGERKWPHEEIKNLWAGNYNSSSVATSISLCVPYISNQTFPVKYWRQKSSVQEILSSKIENTLLPDNRVWNRGVCSFT